MINDDTRPFPIQRDLKRDEKGKAAIPHEWLNASEIPWWLAEVAYVEYSKRFGTMQSLERLAERGGFGRHELLALLKPRKR